jgi:hypothetical protein
VLIQTSSIYRRCEIQSPRCLGYRCPGIFFNHFIDDYAIYVNLTRAPFHAAACCLMPMPPQSERVTKANNSPKNE